MQTHVQKWGNSLALRIPAKLSQQLKLKPGTLVNMDLEQDHLVISLQKYSLKEMLMQIDDNTFHNLVLEDSTQGKEEW